MTTFISINQIYAVPIEISTQLKAISDELQENIEENNGVISSFNPYDYIYNNENYNSIVTLGPEAIPYLEEKIIKSEHNGLMEYIMAIAIEEIAKVDLKKGKEYRWSTAKEFADEWNNHLKNIPNNVKHIITSNVCDEIKNELLIKMGTPAIPYIIDQIDDGHIEIVPLLNELLRGNKWLNADVNSIQYNEKNIKNYVSEFQQLRKLVEKAK